MTQEERQKLIDEKHQLEAKIKKSEFPSPREMRRIEDIMSLLLSDGVTTKLRMVAGERNESTRVTSFTKDRR